MEAHTARERLTHAAIQLFIKNGFNATSVDEICLLGRVSKGAFFHHFRGKEDAAVAVISHAWAMMEERLEDARVESLGEPSDRIAAYLHWLAESLTDPECPLRIVGQMVRETGGTHPRLRDACLSVYDQWQQQIMHLLARADSPAQDLAREIVCTAEGAITLAGATGDARTISQLLLALKQPVKLRW